jgi:hypothetical protein
MNLMCRTSYFSCSGVSFPTSFEALINQISLAMSVFAEVQIIFKNKGKSHQSEQVA